MKKPNREPDFTYKSTRFWYPEMLCSFYEGFQQLYVINGELYSGGTDSTCKLFSDWQKGWIDYVNDVAINKILLGDE